MAKITKEFEGVVSRNELGQVVVRLSDVSADSGFIIEGLGNRPVQFTEPVAERNNAAVANVARENSIGQFKLQLAKALDQSDWEQFCSARERLLEILLDATREEDYSSLKELSRVFSAGCASMVFRHDVNPILDKTGAAWMMHADAKTAESACRSTPQIKETPEELRCVRDQIILALYNEELGGLKTNELAERCGTPASTISRALTFLQSEALVETVAVGRYRVTNLTRGGRDVAVTLQRHASGMTNEPTP